MPLAGGLTVLVAVAAALAAYAAPDSAEPSEPIAAPAPFSTTVTVTVGTTTVTYPNGYCAPMHGWTIRAGDPDTDGVDLTIPPDGEGELVVYGAIGGVGWEIAESPQSTDSGDMSGTFSGRDAISGADVTGIFACK